MIINVDSGETNVNWSDIQDKPSTFDSEWSKVANKPSSFTPAAHNQAASTISAGTFTGKVQANASAMNTLGNAQVRDIYAGTTDMTAGTSNLATGSIYIMYE